MNKQLVSLFLLTACCAQPISADRIWTIGENDNQAKGFALAPNGYKDYLANDFGYEDRYFLIGHSDASKEFPYVIPGLRMNGEELAVLPDGVHTIQPSFSVSKK